MSSWEQLQQGERDAVMKTLHHRLGPLTCLAQLKQLAESAGASSQQPCGAVRMSAAPALVTAACPRADTRAGVKVTGDGHSQEHGGTGTQGNMS